MPRPFTEPEHMILSGRAYLAELHTSSHPVRSLELEFEGPVGFCASQPRSIGLNLKPDIDVPADALPCGADLSELRELYRAVTK